jgi:hypothetical protein
MNSGNPPEIETTSISGTLLLQDGTTRADGAMVILRSASILGMVGDISGDTVSTSDTTITDKGGRYAFQEVKDNRMYSIEAQKDNDAVFIKSVNCVATEPVDMGTDTLKPMGVITGSVYLSGGGDYQNVYVLAFGIDRFVKVKADGTFYFGRLGEGTYTLRIISAIPDYGIADKAGVTVISAGTTDIGRIQLPFTGIPAPSNINVSYDKNIMVTTVSWSPSAARSLLGYNVYLRADNHNFEKISDSASERISDSIVTDTFYRFDVLEYQNATIQVAITAIDSSFAESGLNASEPLQLNSSWCYKTINFENGYPLNNRGVFLTSNRMFVLPDSGTQIQSINGYDLDGNSLGKWSPYTANVIQTSEKFFVDIAFDTDDNCYIAENNRLCKFDISFNFKDSVSGNDMVSYLPRIAGIDGGIVCTGDMANMSGEGGIARFYDTTLQPLGTWKTWAGCVEDFRMFNDTIALVVDVPLMMKREKWIVYLDRQFNELGRHAIVLSEIIGDKIPGNFKETYMTSMDLLANGGFLITAGGAKTNESWHLTNWLWEFDASGKLLSRINTQSSRLSSYGENYIFTDNYGDMPQQLWFHCQ